jgi:site-specific DNA-cytosine methylase
MWGIPSLDMNIVPIAVAEKKPAAIKFILHNYGNKIEHCFEENESLMAGYGKCARHKRCCQHDVPACGVDIMTGGFPCQPHSAARHKTGKTPGTGQPSSHPSYNTLHVGAVDYLQARDPACFCIEQVTTITNIEKVSGKSHLALFVESVRDLPAGYKIHVFHMSHGVFASLPKDRVWVIGVSERCGGDEALQWIVRHIKMAYLTRQATPPVLWIGGIVDIKGHVEVRRMALSQVVLRRTPTLKHQTPNIA